MSWTSNVVRHVFPTGLTLLAERDPQSNVVAVLTHVKAGYFDEPDHWTGISHVLEHMYFKGTGRRKPGDVARDVQLLGGYVNASTIYDKTVYYAVVPATPGALERVLDVQADALTDAAIDRDELTRELEVIIQEAKRKLDTPSAVARESLYELLFTRHPIRRWRIGTEAGLRKLTADDVRAYYHSRYVPSRVTVAIVGDIDVDKTISLAEQTLGSWVKPESPLPPLAQEPNGHTPAFRVMEGDVQRALAHIGWQTVGTLHRDAPALDLMAALLGDGRGSRLYRALRVPGLANSAGAIHYTPTDVGEFDVTLEAELDNLTAAIGQSLEQVADLRRHGPSATALERARALTAVAWSRQFETMDGRARMLCEAEALGGYELTDELYDRFMTTSAEDVQRVAGEFLDPKAASALLYLPTGQTSDLDGRWPPKPLRAGTRHSEPEPPPSPPARSLTDHDGRDLVRHRSGVTRLSLPGIDLLVRPKAGSGLVSLVVHIPGLPTTETTQTAGISRLAVRVAIRGAGGLSGEELAYAAERLGGGIAAGSGVDGLGWGMTVRASALGEAADLIRAVALEPELESSDIEIERKLQASDARRVRDDMFRHPLQRVFSQAFPDDPYGLPSLGDPDVVASISDDAVREWCSQVGRRRAVVVAVGDLSGDQLLTGLASFTSWPGRQAADAAPAETPCFHAGRGMEERDKAQSALAMAYPAQPYGSPERYAAGVLCTVLSGLAGRLFDALREQRSLAYTVAAMPWLRRRAGAILTYIATSPEREEEAREAMLAELARLVTHPVTSDELERARSYAAGTIEISQQRAASIAGDILDAWLYGVIDEFEDDPAKFRSVEVPELTDLAARYFVDHTRAEYVVRGVGKSR